MPRLTSFCNRLLSIVAFLFLVLSLPQLTAAGSAEAEQPNILFILADDLGLEGISAYGGDLVKTPNIDRLANEGMKFTHMFVNPYCTPTRSELLTGRYPYATNTLFPISDYERHKNDVLDTSEPSFARQLKKAGYKTAIAGKWQLSFLSKQDWVHDFGFDTYQFWQIMTADNERTTRYHNPYFRRDGEIVHEEIKDRYGPDVMVDFLTDFIRKSHKEGQPFMAYYTSLLPHFPWVPTPGSKESSMAGSLSSGINYGVPKYYPDMIRRLDHNVGRLLETLDQLGIAKETIVVFLTDNGTDQHLYGKFGDQTLYGGKATLTDRGSLVPLLIRWPRKIQAGSINDNLIEAADFLPTLCEIAGAPLPDQAIQGHSFANILTGEQSSYQPRRWVHVQMEQGRYLRTKKWIVTDESTYKKVQPYPEDAVKVDKTTVDEATRTELQMLEQTLNKLNKQNLNDGSSNSDNSEY
ncbi:sulfatase-like hydrolase/transferase [Aliifodinibius sp. S!AR15-10]|uniref:sulfatase-like hydrolase/transferase n=1 Tax=Aliifodinibius sp. S!AR15-10 TaxID=2950437 RepID=UPI002865ACDB|nr:sulfatase-like hydrolase/transferase [Aliifodinibius sp. S!AR15-10]MDR8390376.1 sulfatase-like hydrolase/transferase [Aliifodinibius sp. S!AR15-10]